MEFDLVNGGTRVTANGDGQSVDVSSSGSRTFLLKMQIDDQIEQESMDMSIYGSADGQTWEVKPILKLPQRFYRGETRAVLDLTLRPHVNFIRAHWELNRWGRVAPTPMFVVGLHASEIPAMPKQVTPDQVAAKA